MHKTIGYNSIPSVMSKPTFMLCAIECFILSSLFRCSEVNLMFREYLRRLESDEVCQNLTMMSFLLLPMQRITRLPLLILAILNRTPLDHPDYGVVEATLRCVQTVSRFACSSIFVYLEWCSHLVW